MTTAQPDGRRGLTVTATLLADGRELLYFDEIEGRRRGSCDRRPLEPQAAQSQTRRDPVSGEWVVFAQHRQERTHLPSRTNCPLCPSRGRRLTEIPDSDYDVVVFENRFPSLVGDASATGAGPGLFRHRAGIGRCEVVCFTSEHRASFAQLSPERALTVGRVWADRTRQLGRTPGVEYVFCFENRGREIGVTLEHPHGQIYAYPIVPPRVGRAQEVAARHARATGSCVACDVIAAELESGSRLVGRTSDCVAFVPFAARWPYEVHIYPLSHAPDLDALTDEVLAQLMTLYVDVLVRFDLLFDRPAPYVAAWVQAPARAGRDLAHVHAELFTSQRAKGRLKYQAGSEATAGVFINDILPDAAAASLLAVTSGAVSPR